MPLAAANYLHRAMAGLHLDRTEKTPEVDFEPEAGLFRLEGTSIHENAERFYRELINHVETYVRHPAARTRIQISLDYFNSSTSKYLLDLLKLLDEVHASGKGEVELEWHYTADDLDMKEAGEDYDALLEMPVRLVSDPLP